MLSVALSELVLVFEETYFCQFHTYLLAFFYEINLKLFTSHIYFHQDDCELCKQYESSSQEMMGQINDLETGITKPCTHFHPSPSTSTQLISTST